MSAFAVWTSPSPYWLSTPNVFVVTSGRVMNGLVRKSGMSAVPVLVLVVANGGWPTSCRAIVE